MLKERILIADDDVAWSRMLANELSSLGFEVVVTQESAEAVRILRRDDRIVRVVLDDIFLALPDNAVASGAKTQDLQGLDVLEDVHKIRPDVQFVVVTGAPALLSGGDLTKAIQLEAPLHLHIAVLDFIHKQHLQSPAFFQRTLDRLAALLRGPGQTVKNEPTGVVLGIGRIAEHGMGQTEPRGRKSVPELMFLGDLIECNDDATSDVEAAPHTVATVLKEIEEGKNIAQVRLFIQRGQQLTPSAMLEWGSSQFRILFHLASEAEKRPYSSEPRRPVVIRPEDYPHTRRNRDRPARPEDDSLTREERQAQQDEYRFGGRAEDGKGPLGVQEHRAGKSRPLTKAIERLRSKLEALLGKRPQDIFSDGAVKGSYELNFPLRLAIYAARESGRRRRRPKT